ncbi:unnamed protein product, partial [Ectocarpus sp. 12 AP-2014]
CDGECGFSPILRPRRQLLSLLRQGEVVGVRHSSKDDLHLTIIPQPPHHGTTTDPATARTVSVTHADECFNSTATLSISRQINLYQLPLRLFLPLFWPSSRQSRSQLGAATVLAT